MVERLCPKLGRYKIGTGRGSRQRGQRRPRGERIRGLEETCLKTYGRKTYASFWFVQATFLFGIPLKVGRGWFFQQALQIHWRIRRKEGSGELAPVPVACGCSGPPSPVHGQVIHTPRVLQPWFLTTSRSSSREWNKGTNFFLQSVLVGEPSPKKSKRALLGDLDFLTCERCDR